MQVVVYDFLNERVITIHNTLTQGNQRQKCMLVYVSQAKPTVVHLFHIVTDTSD